MTALVVLCVALAVTCFAVTKRLVLTERCRREERQRWQAQVERVEGERNDAERALAKLHEAAGAMLDAVADEAERAIGHCEEAFALEALARDVRRARNPFDVVSQDTVAQFVRAGASVPPRPLHVGQAMELAVALDHRARRAERGLYKMTRLCFIDRSNDQEARWLAEVMGLMLGVCHGDEAEARRRLRAAIDVWERTDIYRLADEVLALEKTVRQE